jgi:glycosyltransferase involved in cell wall biosynthesis
MQENFLVSIIIPIYNRFHLLTDVLKNLKSQTYQNFEVIIVDDGSENILEIENHYGLKINYIRLSENKGPGYARKQGRLQAKGKYIAYLDSDDWWSNNFVEQCVKTLESDTSKGMVYTNTIVLWNGNELKRRIKHFQPNTILPTLFVNNKRFWTTASCMWRKEVSLPECWHPLRNHEDYLHDLYCSNNNNNAKFVKEAIAYKNRSAGNRIKRESGEVKKTLNEMVRIKTLPTFTGFPFFIIKKLYEFHITIDFADFKNYLLVPIKEKNFKFSNYFIYYLLLVLIGMLSVKSYKLKSYIQYLK